MGVRGSAEAKDAVNRGVLIVLRRTRGHLEKQRKSIYDSIGVGPVWSAIDSAIKAVDAEIDATQKRIAAT